MRREAPESGRHGGFTLLELMIVVAVLAIVASIGVPQYVSALRIARTGKARQELVGIAQAIDSFRANHGGRLPLTLYQVGCGGKRDPWGSPFCYFNYTDGTGDGLDWAVSAGLVNPTALIGGTVGSLTIGAILPSAIGGGSDLQFAAVDASLRRYPQRPINLNAVPVATVAESLLTRLGRGGDAIARDELLATLPTSGGFCVYTGVVPEAVRRRDQYMFPLNTDYDLFSLGPNVSTAISLGAALAQDDIIRANNGGYFGPASEY